MKKTNKKMLTAFLLSTSLVVGALSFPLTPVSAQTGSVLKLRLLETTDIHTNIVNYDYYQDKNTDEFGLAKTATLVKKAREEAKNSILIDNGDLLQGNPLGDYVAKIDPLKAGDTHPAYKAMNLMDYDVANIGNHEFNFGLDFLGTSLKGAKFPYINANVYVDDKDKNPNNDKNMFTPYEILERTFKDENGKDVKLKVGVIGFVPPQIMQWDKANLEGKVIAKDIVETANKFVPEMKKKGADIIIAVPHSGIGPIEGGPQLENASYQLSKVDGIDAILFGHSHSVFPGPGFDKIPGIDAEKGTLNGKPAVMPGFWGNHLGVIDLTLKQENGKWKVAESATKVVPIYDKANKASLADADKAIVEAVKEDHDKTVDWVRSAVGKTSSPIFSYFALVQDDPSIQIVTNAQKWFVEKNVKGTEYDGIPVLSAGAPFKAGGRNGVSYYSNIPAGTIAIKNVSDLYIYPNTLKAVLVDGATVKEWLERSAGQFNQIDAKKTDEQPLINESFPTYNYDVIDGVTYQIDVTQPSKYAVDGKVANKDANRIKNLSYNGKPVKPEDKFIVVTNNYRASGGGAFPGLDGKNIVIDSPDENRQIVIDYILNQKNIDPAADNNWSFAPVDAKLNVTFTSSPDAKPFAEKMSHIKFINVLESGFAKFSIDLSKPASK
ncbi:MULTISPECIES: bifunctional 2',3'-cyclic-nucleotide 2'-phosphodiesterase/3'-nucleotidase [Brevibacillus]|uniref:Probable 2',3'-cyclic-nucleotide 2'-phosphodiesterase n=1 Tax=Brevibacillus brevis (strain 47 / JCM 6285 / NBRC 100599) TaxID=358681 RepID=C0ZAM8_BREBN|nr:MULTISPECIES: bifunctional 2',3'-cyclic-nucleotide 2'-phosphodiesterase/3'-nucleotidase [Bacillales]MBH0332108.1 2', 3'-cyclic nucleotide 2'-phosphodiesterase [Brevibacillus brevis]NRR01892.1 bifunctional 2',3'-cyclic-nucleotide 2'-phosphodiesterase/3'-nucleotidase [Brevibacillus sp. RS1.1]NRS48359.1 bifunctional 2',3'-cyclic-nucleotide 2'-phosphodiesterase/3'-nucleotidase [Brevibacillus sp. HB2.2]TQR39231.1 bifunctional 2',3'-cyclic-nucleotide 2'-phosphodiesterase/3'-nucleotidase [Lysinibac